MMTVEQMSGGLWAVKRDGVVIETADSHREAWRVLDRLQGEPISRVEDVSDWVSRQGT